MTSFCRAAQGHPRNCRNPNLLPSGIGPKTSSWRCCAFKPPSEVQPPVSTPEGKTLQSMVETGIRGSVAVGAAYTLHLNLFSYIHGDISHIMQAVQLAVPCLTMEAALLLVSNTLNEPAAAKAAAAAAGPLMIGSGRLPLVAVQEAVDAIYLHSMRYSLMGAAPAAQRLLLEAGAQLSEDLLARGVLLGCSTAWLTSRLVEANICEAPSLLLSTSAAAAAAASGPTLCSTGVEWVAAAAFCCLIGARYATHSRTKAANLRGRRQAAAVEAAARQQLLRYEPKAVQDAAAETASSQAASSLFEADNAELVAQLVHGWLGARCVVGQGTMFAAFITTGDLLASFAAGLVMQFMGSLCCEQYLHSLRQR